MAAPASALPELAAPYDPTGYAKDYAEESKEIVLLVAGEGFPGIHELYFEQSMKKRGIRYKVLHEPRISPVYCMAFVNGELMAFNSFGDVPDYRVPFTRMADLVALTRNYLEDHYPGYLTR
ncbi:hypothetical protein AUC70_05845 [Methyloceanibacter stevinii]|uniref:Uncharacterized protein n=1 Tax=Methyloceanibacter stevinii TaxID=1774970 RepID=A0A1E3VNW6_9HYPH|nr:hypothetical protein [Methyloceanibacter stevinii]ODR95220.1 hypothetical protein AUC70_05845 [Methyloceanibacter stevinii]